MSSFKNKHLIYFLLLSGSENSVDQDVNNEPMVKKSTDNANGVPKETQMAQCTVTTGEIKASAQATFSRKIEGDFCLSSERKQKLKSEKFLIKNHIGVILQKTW